MEPSLAFIAARFDGILVGGPAGRVVGGEWWVAPRAAWWWGGKAGWSWREMDGWVLAWRVVEGGDGEPFSAGWAMLWHGR
jgi:hypothetical protein